MKGKLLFIFIFISAMLFAQNKSPKIFAPETNHHFGDIQEGKLIKYNFVIKNKGDADLKIVKVRASCGCTAATPAKKILPPGDSTNIMITFNSAHRSGLQRKHVYIYSNDTENPQMRLSFTGNVVTSELSKKMDKGPRIHLSSTQYNFGTVHAGTVVTGKLRFTNTGKGTLQIERLESSAKYVSVNTDKNILTSGASGELSIKFNSANRTGKITRTVTVYSNDLRNPREIITIFINIVPKEK